jgi:hypothetical protein
MLAPRRDGEHRPASASDCDFDFTDLAVHPPLTEHFKVLTDRVLDIRKCLLASLAL